MAANHSETQESDEYFDPYDKAQMGAFIQKQVQAALAPSRQQQTDAELAKAYNDTLAKYGSDRNFKTTMAQALENCLRDSQTGKKFDIQSAYEAASDSESRQRPGSHLPKRAATIAGLGQLIEHNVRTGRARPYKTR